MHPVHIPRRPGPERPREEEKEDEEDDVDGNREEDGEWRTGRHAAAIAFDDVRTLLSSGCIALSVCIRARGCRDAHFTPPSGSGVPSNHQRDTSETIFFPNLARNQAVIMTMIIRV